MPLEIAHVRQARPENDIRYFATIGSTMTEAMRLGEANAPHGTVVIADEQTAGVGRLGRNWISQAGVGLYCSILLRLELPPAKIPVASLLLGLAVKDAIQQVTNLICDLRWPNDVLINDKKVCGILAQLAGSCIVTGIGINVGQTSFEPGLRTPATSLLIESGIVYSRERLLLALLASIDDFCLLLHNQGSDGILKAFTAASTYAQGRQVTVEDTELQGVTDGLDEFGFLMLRTPKGTLQRLSAGGVRAAR